MPRFFRAALWVAPAVVLMLALGPAGRAEAASVTTPWNLAVVVDLTGPVDAPWLGATRRRALQSALEMELRTLPLRVTAGVWAAGGNQAAQVIKPRRAVGLKGLDLKLPGLAGPGGLAQALDAAADWTGRYGGGSILLLTGPWPAGAAPALPARFKESGGYLHVFALGVKKDHQRQDRLAVKGGGLLFIADRPADTARLLRRAVSAALSPSFLILLAYDQDNRPLQPAFDLKRRDQAWGLVSGRAHRRMQLPSGVYRLLWPAGPPRSVGKPPAAVTVEDEGLTKVWLGGNGRLAIKGEAAEGGPLDWAIKVSRVDDGRLVKPYGPLPLDLKAPSGRYLITSRKPAHQWSVELAAGGEVKVMVGPPARLDYQLRGPAGPLRVPYAVTDLNADRRVATGYTNAPLRILPGRYRLDLKVFPPVRREISVLPGRKLAILGQPLGVIKIVRGPSTRLMRYWITDGTGRLAAKGVGERMFPLGPGYYRVRFMETKGLVSLHLKSGQLAVVKPPNADVH